MCFAPIWHSQLHSTKYWIRILGQSLMETMPLLSLRYIPLWVEDVSRRTIVQIITKYKVSREMGLCRVIIMEGRKQTGPKEGHKPVVCVEGLFWIV